MDGITKILIYGTDENNINNSVVPLPEKNCCRMKKLSITNKIKIIAVK